MSFGGCPVGTLGGPFFVPWACGSGAGVAGADDAREMRIACWLGVIRIAIWGRGSFPRRAAESGAEAGLGAEVLDNPGPAYEIDRTTGDLVMMPGTP